MTQTENARQSKHWWNDSQRLDETGRHSVKGLRRLSITVAGKWYVALTILIGVTALASGNNTIYLVESLLLSGLILSGVLSEQVISQVHVRIQRFPVSAGVPSGGPSINHDVIYLTNRTRHTLFCIEVGEWIQGKFVRLAFVPALGGQSTLSVKSEQVFQKRGNHSWDALAVATLYPFGFAKKIRLIRAPGQRIVWPAQKNSHSQLRSLARPSRKASDLSTVEGEVRPMSPGDDYRQVVWTLSSRGGELHVRLRRAESPEIAVVLDLRNSPGEHFEKTVIEAAAPFYNLAQTQSESLLLISSDAKRRVFGRKAALDELANVQPETKTQVKK